MTDDDNARLYLTAGQKAGTVWPLIEQHLHKRLARLRKQNDGDMPEAATARLRGRILEIKALIALGDDPPET